MMKCDRCGELFSDEDMVRIPEYVDDSRIIAFYSYECPYCGSGSIDEYYDPGEDEE